MNDDQDLVAIATFGSDVDAKIRQIALIDRGIKATISGDVTAFGVGAAGVTVYVRRIEAEEARKIMKEMVDEKPLPEWKCKCGETVDEGYAICWSCGAEFSEQE